MIRPSLTLIISLGFLAFILQSIYSLIVLYRAPVCSENETCYPSYLNNKPNLELLAYISDNSKYPQNELSILHVDKFNYDVPFSKIVEINISKNVRHNGSLVIHTVLIPRRGQTEAKIGLHEARSLHDSTYIKNYLTRYEIPKSATFNLLQHEAAKQQGKPVPHLKTRFAITMVNEELHIPHTAIPLEILRYMRINKQKQFMPIILHDSLQTRLKDLEEITQETAKMKFEFVYNPSSIGKFKFLVQLEETFRNFMKLGFTYKDVDEVKGVFADSNLYLLCATMLIGGIHLLLDFLSFKNDVSFWKTHKSMAGLSVRTVVWRSFSQTVIFLYLMDEGTSLLVLIPSGIGMLIEFWKITKVFKITLHWTKFKIDRNIVESEAEAKTRKYDEESMTYLSYVLYPMVFCAAAYSLIYQPHKSWYSWTINSMVNGVYVFGFVFMLPQLFINYRLKSVAALPWRAFTYRAFNTFIDDIFAFIITMPTAHRIACFRDDVVFIIYLYQRWLYPVDTTRVDDGTGEPEKIEDKKTK